MKAQRTRRGFTLMEVMIALGILVVSLVILVETQSTAAQMTLEADKIITATNLANEKMAEVRTLVEFEGFSQDDVYEDGDFDDFGDEAVDLEFEDLADYHYEYLVTELDLGLAGDLARLSSNLQSQLGFGDDADNPALASAGVPDLSSFGISEDMIGQMLQPFLREVRVRVWWGEDQEEAEQQGNEVVITTHMINPHGNMLGAAGLGGGGGGAPGANNANPFGGGAGGNPFGGGAGRANPFGGATGGNPFGGAAGNPFGAPAAGNPFGGGGR